VAKPLLLACPRVAPDWELAALQALIKPQLRGAILHRDAQQVMPRDWRAAVEAVAQSLASTIGFEPALHYPEDGDYWFAGEVNPEQTIDARAMAVALTQNLPDVWMTVGKLFVRDGQFFRRQFGVKLNLVPAANIHLPRGVRASLPKIQNLSMSSKLRP
jgi:hypothetical protein